MTEINQYQKVKAKALRALARRDHGRLELKQKLATITEDEVLIEKILTECEAHNWLNESRFVVLYLRYRAQRGFGPRKIRYELQQRGISNTLIDQAFIASECDWQELAEHTRQKKFGVAAASSWIEQAKQNHYLYQRGF